MVFEQTVAPRAGARIKPLQRLRQAQADNIPNAVVVQRRQAAVNGGALHTGDDLSGGITERTVPVKDKQQAKSPVSQRRTGAADAVQHSLQIRRQRRLHPGRLAGAREAEVQLRGV